MVILSTCLYEAADSAQAPPSGAGTAPAPPAPKPAASGASGATQVQPPPVPPSRCVQAEKYAGSQGLQICFCAMLAYELLSPLGQLFV